jgi:NTE family protein
MTKAKRYRMGLALGAGGARGLAHLGVLKVFDQEKIPVDIIAGTSIGALVGAAYASGISPEELRGKVEEYLKSPDFQSSAIKAIEDAHARGEMGLGQKIQHYVKNRYYLVQALFRPAILSKEDFEAMIHHFIPDMDIEATRIPFRAVSTDLVTGEQIVFSRGSLRQAVMASCAMPGAIEPLREGDMLLSDGGIICLVPSSVIRKEGAEVVVAVAVDRDICTEMEFRTAMTIYSRVCDIMANRLKTHELMDADIIIRPEVGDLHWSEFSQALSLVESGEQAARESLEAIRHAMPGRKRWFTLRQILRSCRKQEG